MGAILSITGFRPADDRWNKMKMIWDSCTAAGIDVPEEVLEFFDHECPGDKPGMEVDILRALIERSRFYDYDIDVNKLPKDCSIIRARIC